MTPANERELLASCGIDIQRITTDAISDSNDLIAEMQSTVDRHVKAGRLTTEQAEGLPEFLVSLCLKQTSNEHLHK